jgi:ankyrin repeat protein
MTPLLWAAKNGQIEVVKLLLEKGANSEAKDKSDRTALMLAVANGKTDVAALLREKGAQ